jgi:transcriptional regulator with XRE-family HTH domain
MENNKAQFAQRLIEAMQAAGYAAKPAVLEREFNLRFYGKPMTLQGVRRWLIGETMPSHDKLRTLADWLHISPEELSFGAELPKKIEQRRKEWEVSISYQEREVFEAFLSLPAEQKKIVREVILAFVRASRAA